MSQKGNKFQTIATAILFSLLVSGSSLAVTLTDIDITRTIPQEKRPTVFIAPGVQVSQAEAQSGQQKVTAGNGISQLAAVREGRSYAIWHNFYNSPYNTLAIQAFAKWFYPEPFASLDVAVTERKLYKQFLAVEPGGTYWTEA